MSIDRQNQPTQDPLASKDNPSLPQPMSQGEEWEVTALPAHTRLSSDKAISRTLPRSIFHKSIQSLQRTHGNTHVRRILGDGNEGATLQRTIVQRDVGTGPGKGPVKTATGLDALKALAILQSNNTPIVVNSGVMGEVKLVPGANYGDKILIYASPLAVYYIDGIDLYEAYTPDFIRDMWLTAFAQGAKNAEWLIPIMKAEMAFIMAFIAPWYVMLGMGILKGIVFYASNKQEIAFVSSHFATVNRLRSEVKKRYPEMYNSLFSECIEQAIAHIPEGIELEDITYLIGRIIGLRGLLGEIEAGTEITLKVLAKIIIEYTLLISVLHGPSIIAHGMKRAVNKEAKKLQQKLSEQGINVSEGQARKIVKEIYKDSGGQDILVQLQQNLQELQESLKKLQESAQKNY